MWRGGERSLKTGTWEVRYALLHSSKDEGLPPSWRDISVSFNDCSLLAVDMEWSGDPVVGVPLKAAAAACVHTGRVYSVV